MGKEIADRQGFRDYFSNVGSKAGFVIGGYSYLYRSFKMQHILYRPSASAFVRRPAIPRYMYPTGQSLYELSRKAARRNNATRQHDSTGICFAGDYIEDFLDRLSDKIQGKTTLDWEPLAVLVEMLSSEEYVKIGGAPQVVKVYSHRNTLPYGILWRKPNYIDTPEEASKSVFVFGRPLMHYERTTWPILDAENLAEPIYPLQAIKPLFR
jgi:hypothetical protein